MFIITFSTRQDRVLESTAPDSDVCNKPPSKAPTFLFVSGSLGKCSIQFSYYLNPYSYQSRIKIWKQNVLQQRSFWRIVLWKVVRIKF